MKHNTNKWKTMPYPCIRRVNIVEMSILPKIIYRFSAIPYKISMAFFFFYRNRTNNPKIHMESQVTMNSQSNLEKEQGWSHHTS